MAPRILFEQELELLKTKVAEMGERAESSYYKLLTAVKHNDRVIFHIHPFGESQTSRKHVVFSRLALNSYVYF